MENCKVVGCKFYAGRDCKTVCTWHQVRFDIQNVIFFESHKHRGVGQPVHNGGKQFVLKY